MVGVTMLKSVFQMYKSWLAYKENFDGQWTLQICKGDRKRCSITAYGLGLFRVSKSLQVHEWMIDVAEVLLNRKEWSDCLHQGS